MVTYKQAMQAYKKQGYTLAGKTARKSNKKAASRGLPMAHYEDPNWRY